MPVTPIGSEFIVNTTTTGEQSTYVITTGIPTQSVAMDGAGNYIITWISEDDSTNPNFNPAQPYGVYAQRYNSLGQPQGSEFLVNRVQADNQIMPSVAMSRVTGESVIVWASTAGTGDVGSFSVFAQRYDASGTPLFVTGGPTVTPLEQRVNVSSTPGNFLPLDQDRPRVAMDAAGNFVVTWTSQAQDLDGTGVYARRYDKTSGTWGSEFRVNTTTLGNQESSAIAMSDSGAFVIIWTGEDGGGKGIFAQRYDATGTPSGNEFRINTRISGDQQEPSIAMDAAGNFVVAWSSPGDGLNSGIFAQRFDANGTAIGSEFQVNTFFIGEQRNPSVAMAQDGKFVITWSSIDQDGSGWGVIGQRYTADGTPIEGEFLVNTTTDADQRYSSAAMDNAGNFIINWTGQQADGTLDVYGQRFEAVPNNAPSGLDLSNDTIAENVPATTTVGTFSTIDADIGNTFTYTLVSGTGSDDNGSFSISGNQLRITTSPNFEAKTIYNIRIRTTDQGGLFFERPLTVLITNVNESATNIDLSASGIAEDAPLNTVIGNLTNNDPDAGDTFTYSLVAGAGLDTTTFRIVGNQLVTNAPLDFETQPNYTVRIRVADAQGAAHEQTLFIGVTNVNEAPTTIDLTPKTVAEDAALNTLVGTFTTDDPDDTTGFTYTLVAGSGFDTTTFAIVGNELRTNALLNHEGQPTYTIRVRTTDAGGQSTEETFTINVGDVNEQPTAVNLDNPFVSDGTPSGTPVGTLTTIDPDTTGTFTYSFVPGFDEASFAIVGDELRLNTTANFANDPSYTIRVRTTDQGGLSFDQDITINVNPPGPTAPVDITLTPTPTTIDENVGDNAVVGTLNSIDPNAGDTFTYTFVPGFDEAAFEIVSGNQLRIRTSPNFEDKALYTVRIRSTDSTTLFRDETFTIGINNLNEAPTDIALNSTTIAEDVNVGTVVGTLSSNDPDNGETLTYTLVAGAGLDTTTFTIASNELRTNAPLDFETTPTYTIRVRVTDSQGLSTEKDFTIGVTNINEAPTALNLNPSAIDENVALGSPIGTFTTTDPDNSTGFTYTLLSGTGLDDTTFTIVGNELRTNAALNREGRSQYTIRVRTTDAGGKTFEQDFTIDINNLNETATDITVSATAVNNGAPAGSVVGTLGNNDPDVGDTFTYTLVAGAGDTDNGKFSIDSSGQLVINEIPDFFTQSQYSIRVQVTDAAGSTFIEPLIIRVTDPGNVNPSDIALNPAAIDENVTPNTLVGTLTSSDLNPGNTFTYTLVTGGADFEIVGDQLLIKNSPDFEAQSSYTIRVRTSDQDNGTFEKDLTIAINDRNEGATTINLDNNSVDEGTASDRLVGTLSNNDPDTTDTFTYTLVSGAGLDTTTFKIVGNQILTNAALDADGVDRYNIRVRVADAAGLATERNFSILVNNLNEQPTDITLSIRSVNDGAPADTVVGTLGSVDPDSGNTFTYTLVSGSGDTDNGDFSINGDLLQINTPPDFANKPTYTIRVRTTDQGGLSTEKEFTVNVNVAPNDLTLNPTPTAIDENVPTDTIVGTFSSTDPNAGDTFSYSLVSGTGDTDNASFRISNDQLLVTTSPDFEAKPSYSILVRTTDQNGLSFDRVFAIDVNNLVDPGNRPPQTLTLSGTAVDENVAPNFTVGTFTTVDPDGGTFTYSLVAGQGSDDNSAFTISGNQLVLTNSPNFEAKQNYSIRVRTTDQDGASLEQEFVIAVNNQVEPGNATPSDIGLNPTAIDENVVADSLIGTFTTTDTDGGTFTYSLVAGQGSDDNSAFTISGDQLLINASPDFEAKPSYKIRVRSTDADGAFTEKELTVTVNNLVEGGNRPPQTLSLSSTAVDENVAANFTVGTFSTVDPDGGTFTYSLVAGQGADDNSAFTISGNQLVLTNSPNFESQSSYKIRVSTTDQDGATLEQEFVIAVNNQIEPGNATPSDIGLTPTAVDENVAANFAIGTFSTVDTDGGSFIYSLVAGQGADDNSAFTISGDQLLINASPDFEAQPSYKIRVRSTDADGAFTEKELIVTINNLVEGGNQAPQTLTLSGTSVDENVAPNFTVGTFSTVDPDGGSFTYSLVSGQGADDNSAFTISGNQLVLTNSPNFESQSSYKIRVSTTDQDGATLEQEFVIAVNNQVEPGNATPTDIGLSPAAVDENVAANFVIGSFSTTDTDGGTFTYSLVAGQGGDDNSAFTVSGNQLLINASPDFEAQPSYKIRIRSTDADGAFTEKELTVTINNLVEGGNRPPQTLSLSGTSVDENVAANFTVGTFTTVDPDGGTFTYSLVTGQGADDNSAFTISGNQLVLTNSPNFESQSSYKIRVRTTDQDGATLEQEFVIAVNNQVEPGNATPTDIGLSPAAVDENVAANFVIGTFSTTDTDGGTFTYSLVTGQGSDDNSAFTISGNQLLINASPDFEAQPSYKIRVRSTDADGAFTEKELTVTINNLVEGGNRPPQTLSLSGTSVDENVAANFTVGTFTTVDPDGGSFTYSLVVGQGADDNSAFTISGNQLVLTNSPNFESQPSYKIRVRTTDLDGASLEEEFVINVNNQVEPGNATPTDIGLSPTAIDENSAANSPIGTLTTTDTDGGTFTYSLVAGQGADDNSAFTISGNQLLINASPDFEAKPSYKIRVRSTDADGAFTEKELIVTINNLIEGSNRPPSDIGLSGGTIAENSASPAIVGTLTSTDDPGNTFTYSLVAGGVDNGSFTINGDQLSINVSADFEAKPSYSILVRSTDQDGGFFDKVLTIAVTNVNETPTDLALSTGLVNEGVPANSIVGTFSTTDPDSGNTFTYSLVSGAGATDNAAFTISGNQLLVTNPPNFATQQTYNIRVRSTDQGGLTVEKALTLTVNANPTDIALSATAINENSPANSAIGSFSTTDGNTGDTFTYSLVSGTGATDNAAFTISGNQLLINASPDFEAKPSYSILVRTTDQGGRTFDKNFTITVNNVLEATNRPPFNLAFSTPAINEGIPANTAIGSFTTSDLDPNDTFTYTFVTGIGSTDNSAFTLSGNQLLINASPSFDLKTSYSVRVRTTDQDGGFFERSFTIAVNNINSPPSDLALNPNTVNENVPNGTVVGNFTSTDSDAGDTFTYQLIPGVGATDNALFTLSSAGQLSLNSSPNFETKSSYSIRVKTTDSTGLSFEKVVTVGVNDIPNEPTIVTTSGGTAAFTEDAAPVAIDPGLTLRDDDSPTVTGATISIIGGFAGQDVLNFVDQNGITGSYSNGVLTLTGTAPIAAYESALRSITYSNTSNTPNTNPRTIQFSVTADGSNSNLATRQVTVAAVNDAPIVSTPGITLYSENGGAIAVDSAVTIADPDSSTLTSATVSILGFIPGQETLNFTNQSGITGNFNASNGILALTGSATIAAYEAALRSITYVNTSDNPPASREVSFKVNDGAIDSATVNHTIQITATNDSPVLTLSRGSAPFQRTAGSIILDNALTLADPDSPALAGATVTLNGFIAGEDRLDFISQNGITGVFNNGVLSLSGAASIAAYQAALRSITYSNNSSTPTGTPRFAQFSVTDGTASSNTGTVQITLNNAAPVVDLNGSGQGIDHRGDVLIGASARAAGLNLTLTDSDSTMLSWAIVVISNPIDWQQERLTATTTDTGIVASYNSEAGVLRLTGAASVETYQQVLRSVTYSNSSPTPDRTLRNILFVANDGDFNSVVATTRMGFTTVNVMDGTDLIDPVMETTPFQDQIRALSGDDSVRSNLAFLQQDDTIDGGLGNDTFTLTDGTGSVTINLVNATNQMTGITPIGTTITNFERFDLSRFNGNATMIGSDAFNNTLTSGSGSDRLIGGANNDFLSSNGGDDFLDGGFGNDLMLGGTGDDFYVVDSPNDIAIEGLNSGIDTVQSSIDHTLSANIEKLTLTVDAALGIGNDLDNTLTGNDRSNLLIGNAGNDRLVGGNGRDRLAGGLGDDILIGGNGRDVMRGNQGRDSFYLTNSRRANLDRIAGFNVLDDTIFVSKTGIARNLRRGRISADQFTLGTGARDSNDRFVYDRQRGALYFDRDGIGRAAQVQIAILPNRPNLTAQDIVIY